MTLDRESALIEAVLFLESEPQDARSLAKITGLSKDLVDEVLTRLRERYAEPCHGIEILELGGGFLLAPKADLWEHLKERYGRKNEGRLSRAAIETLSIIAYTQPITKGEIEGIRGVSSDGMIRLLLQKELIREVGKKDSPGRPTQFGTTKEFLKQFRLNSIADLPKLDEIERDRFELESNEEDN